MCVYVCVRACVCVFHREDVFIDVNIFIDANINCMDGHDHCKVALWKAKAVKRPIFKLNKPFYHIKRAKMTLNNS